MVKTFSSSEAQLLQQESVEDCLIAHDNTSVNIQMTVSEICYQMICLMEVIMMISRMRWVKNFHMIY